jgi:hypothetical protein
MQSTCGVAAFFTYTQPQSTPLWSSPRSLRAWAPRGGLALVRTMTDEAGRLMADGALNLEAAGWSGLLAFLVWPTLRERGGHLRGYCGITRCLIFWSNGTTTLASFRSWYANSRVAGTAFSPRYTSISCSSILIRC